MASRNGGEEHLAPVIPLFGGRAPEKKDEEHADVPRRTGADGLWRSALADGPSRQTPLADVDDRLEPVSEDLDELAERRPA